MACFCDASEDAFCAVPYLVTETRKAEQKVFLIMGKARVALVKHHTNPKLELMTAGNRLKDAIIKEHSSFSQKVYVVRFYNSNSVDQVKQRQETHFCNHLFCGNTGHFNS